MAGKLNLNSVVDILILEALLYTNAVLVYFLWISDVFDFRFPFHAIALLGIITLAVLRQLSTRFLQKTPQPRTVFERLMYCVRVIIRIEPVATVTRGHSEEIKEIRLVHSCLEALPSALLITILLLLLDKAEKLREIVITPLGILMILSLVWSGCLIAWTASAVQDRKIPLLRTVEALYVAFDIFSRIVAIAITAVVLTHQLYDARFMPAIVGIIVAYILLNRYIWLRCNISGAHRSTSPRVNCTRAEVLSVFLFCCVDLGRGHFMNTMAAIEAGIMVFAAEYLTLGEDGGVFTTPGNLYLVISAGCALGLKFVLEYLWGPFSIADEGRLLGDPKKECPGCSFMNPLGRKNCEKCDRELPSNVDYGLVDDEIPRNYVWENNQNAGEQQPRKSHETREPLEFEMDDQKEHVPRLSNSSDRYTRSPQHSHHHHHNDRGSRSRDGFYESKSSSASSGSALMPSHPGLSDQPQYWTCEEVGLYLSLLGPGFRNYTDLFQEHLITGDVFLALDDSDLSHLIDLPLHRKALKRQIKELREIERKRARGHHYRPKRNSRQHSEPIPASSRSPPIQISISHDRPRKEPPHSAHGPRTSGGRRNHNGGGRKFSPEEEQLLERERRDFAVAGDLSGGRYSIQANNDMQKRARKQYDKYKTR